MTTTHRDIIAEFGLKVPTNCFTPDVDGLEAYLTELADGTPLFVSAKEAATPFHPEIAQELYGTPHLVPGSPAIGLGSPDTDFDKLGAIIAIIRPFRAADGRPIDWTNWYRPPKYNARVKGAAGSDHVRATAVDLTFRSADHRNACAEHLEPLWERGDLMLSLGFYTSRIHVGILDDTTIAKGAQRAWGPTRPNWAR